jgi:4-hydroxy-2-oxoheptanedioate aldolase
MPRASLKDRLARGEICFGPFMKLSDPAAVEVFGIAGFDHVIIDMEHGPLSVERAQDLIRAAQLRGIAPMARVSENSADLILRVLDIGAEGVHIPQINSAGAAAAAIEACYYHPLGKRGVCRFVRAADYSGKPAAQHFADANACTLPVLHIEGKAGIEALPEILEVLGATPPGPVADGATPGGHATGGLGVVFIGPYDLSQSCGVPGEVRHPLVVERMKHAVELARAKGVVVGTFIEDAEGAARWAAVGVQYLCYSVDVGILREAATRAIAELRGAVL